MWFVKDMCVCLIFLMDIFYFVIFEWDIFYEGNDFLNGYCCVEVFNMYNDFVSYK